MSLAGNGGENHVIKRKRPRLKSAFCFLSIMVVSVCVFICSNPVETAVGGGNNRPKSVELSLQFPGLDVEDNGNGTQSPLMDGYPNAKGVGLPALPSRVFVIALPPGTQASQAVIVNEDWYEVPGKFRIEWGQQPLTGTAPQEGELPTKADEDVYSSDVAFPATAATLEGNGRMRGISLAEVRVSPVRYHAKSGRLEACRSMIVRIDVEAGTTPLPQELAAQPFDETVREIVYNYDQSKAWYEKENVVETRGLTTLETGDTTDYVIITKEALAAATEPLKAYKESQGLSVAITTTEWVELNCSGIDLPDKIRNYLRDNYATLGIDYVLLAGSDSTIPMRDCYAPTPGMTAPIATDYYYSDLSGDWDLNDDGRYGEPGIDDLAGGVDYFPEVYVGRIPTDDAAQIDAICRKIVAFSQDTGTWKDNSLLIGAVSNFSLELPAFLATYGSTLSEKIKTDVLDPLAYQSTTLYEKEGIAPDQVPCDLPLSRENIVAAWPTGYGVVNMVGHGSPWDTARKIWQRDDGNGIPDGSEVNWITLFRYQDTLLLDDAHPSVVFSCACSNAYPSDENSLMISLMKNGACATVGATFLSNYVAGWQSEYYGGNNTMSYMFWKYFLQDGHRIGKSLRMADVWMKNNCDWLGNWNRANLYLFNLYGDPSMKMDAEGDPSISSINPQSSWNSGQITITINGSNFLEGARARLVMEGQGDIAAAVVSVDSSVRLSATFDINAAPVGKWDVVVENPDGRQALLEDAFEVTAMCGTGGGVGLLMLGLSLGILYTWSRPRMRRRK
jgi:hypothetical protein